jgi:hypothetical protein
LGGVRNVGEAVNLIAVNPAVVSDEGDKVM